MTNLLHRNGKYVTDNKMFENPTVNLNVLRNFSVKVACLI